MSGVEMPSSDLFPRPLPSEGHVTVLCPAFESLGPCKLALLAFPESAPCGVYSALLIISARMALHTPAVSSCCLPGLILCCLLMGSQPLLVHMAVFVSKPV